MELAKAVEMTRKKTLSPRLSSNHGKETPNQHQPNQPQQPNTHIPNQKRERKKTQTSQRIVIIIKTTAIKVTLFTRVTQPRIHIFPFPVIPTTHAPIPDFRQPPPKAQRYHANKPNKPNKPNKYPSTITNAPAQLYQKPL